MCVLEIHPWEERVSVPRGTSPGLTSVNEAAQRKQGSKATPLAVFLAAARSVCLISSLEQVLIDSV